MSRFFVDRQELANYIDNEGGIFSALRSGRMDLRSMPDGDKELKLAFAPLITAFAAAEVAAELFKELLPQPSSDY